MVSNPSVDEQVSLPRRIGGALTRILGKYGAIIALIVLLVIFTSISPEHFLNWTNLVQILNQSALTIIIAGGLTIVLAANQFDLSIGYMASLSGMLVTILMLSGVPIALAIIIAVASGAVVGAINGFLVTKMGVNALVATLGVGSVLIGVNYFISGGSPQVASQEFISIAVGNWFGIPRPVYYMVVIAVILWIVLNRTDLGRDIRAVGGNEEAARLAGVRSKSVTTVAFIFAGVMAAISGILLASTVGSGQPTAGDGYTLSAFAAAFLGTTVLREGQFHILGTVVGVITVSVGFNGLALAGVPSYAQFLFQGLLLIAAVSFSTVARRFSRTS